MAMSEPSTGRKTKVERSKKGNRSASEKFAPQADSEAMMSADHSDFLMSEWRRKTFYSDPIIADAAVRLERLRAEDSYD
jgi:hypothetical protein